jgi:hypothetical protein
MKDANKQSNEESHLNLYHAIIIIISQNYTFVVQTIQKSTTLF